MSRGPAGSPIVPGGAVAAAQAPLLIASQVARQYGRRRVLRDVSFEGRRGEVIGLLGPNGSGKTTLLGVLSTLAEPSRGRVVYPAAGALDSPRRALGVLGHEPQVYGELTARENLVLFARLAGVADVAGVVDRALAQARIADRADEPVERFSRGMRQRLAFERVLLHAPSILLLDEPFTGLDDESARSMIVRLAALRDAGTLVVLATHDLALVEGLVDRAFVVKDGRLVGLDRNRTIADGYRAVVAGSVDQVGRLDLAAVAVAAAGEPAPAGDVALRDVVAATAVLVGKDLRIEHRSREGLLTTVFFALSCVLVFSFALVRNGTPAPDAGPAVLWVAVALSGTLAMARTFERERSAGTLAAILVSPAPRPAVFLGKWIALMALLFAVEAILLPLVALFFQMPIGGQPWAILALLAAGTAGYAAIGTLFAAMLARTRTRDVLLPLLLYPMSVPIIIGGVRGTAAALADPYVPGQVSLWLSLLICFDAVFVTLALWTFGTLMIEAAPRVAKEA